MTQPVDKLDFWKDRIADSKRGGRYENYSVYIANPRHWAHIEEIHNGLLGKLIPADAKVLDGGCAYGRFSPLFDNYVGIDFSPDFIEEAKKKYPNKDFRVADLKDLPFKDQEFDFAVLGSIKAMIIGNLGQEEWDIMENELRRVARKVIILEYTDPEIYEVL